MTNTTNNIHFLFYFLNVCLNGTCIDRNNLKYFKTSKHCYWFALICHLCLFHFVLINLSLNNSWETLKQCLLKYLKAMCHLWMFLIKVELFYIWLLQFFLLVFCAFWMFSWKYKLKTKFVGYIYSVACIFISFSIPFFYNMYYYTVLWLLFNFRSVFSRITAFCCCIKIHIVANTFLIFFTLAFFHSCNQITHDAF